MTIYWEAQEHAVLRTIDEGKAQPVAYCSSPAVARKLAAAAQLSQDIIAELQPLVAGPAAPACQSVIRRLLGRAEQALANKKKGHEP